MPAWLCRTVAKTRWKNTIVSPNHFADLCWNGEALVSLWNSPFTTLNFGDQETWSEHIATTRSKFEVWFLILENTSFIFLFLRLHRKKTKEIKTHRLLWTWVFRFLIFLSWQKNWRLPERWNFPQFSFRQIFPSYGHFLSGPMKQLMRRGCARVASVVDVLFFPS